MEQSNIRMVCREAKPQNPGMNQLLRKVQEARSVRRVLLPERTDSPVDKELIQDKRHTWMYKKYRKIQLENPTLFYHWQLGIKA